MKLGVVIAFAALGALVGPTTATVAHAAEDEPQLAMARSLFAEALRDEEAHRYLEALSKFERVQRVRDTTAVRYRMAACLAGAGRVREARDAYQRVTAAKHSSAEDAEVGRAAAEEALRLNLLVREEPTDSVPPNVASSEANAAAPAASQGREPPPESPKPAASPSDTRGLGYAALSAGVVFGATAIAFTILRERAIDDIEEACPAGRCPRSRAAYVADAEDRAKVASPLALGAAALSIVGLGLGTYWLWIGPGGTRASASAGSDFALLRLEGTL